MRFRLGATKRHLLEWYREVLRDLLPRPLVRIISRIGALGEAAYRRLTGWKPVAPPVIIEALPAAVPVPEPAPEPAPETAPPEPPSALRPTVPEVRVSLGGVVYTSMLNPTDGRKNWHDILTAFCWALRDAPWALLIPACLLAYPALLALVGGLSARDRRDLSDLFARRQVQPSEAT